MEQPEVEKLVEDARAGDREARGLLAERFGDRLRSWIKARVGRRLGRAVNAEDLLQETFLQAFRVIPRLQWRGEEAFLGWLRTLAEHVIRDEVKRLGARKRAADRGISLQEEVGGEDGRPVGLDAFLPAPSTTASRELQREERFERLEKALDSLPPDYRKVIQLVSVRGLSMKDAARRMGRSPDAVTMLHLRALRKLRAAYGETDTESLNLPHDRALDPGKEKDDDQ
jgi:RNA polymerase sigma-70 factor (subfamily 1)